MGLLSSSSRELRNTGEPTGESSAKACWRDRFFCIEGVRQERRVHTAAERALGVHRVLEPAGVLPQAARRVDADPTIGPDEVRIAVERLNLDAASFRQLTEARNGDGDA